MNSSLDITSNDQSRAGASVSDSSTIQILDPLAVSDWDAQVMALPGYSFFHGAAWARVLDESYGYKPVYFARTEAGQIRALLPMMQVDSWLTGKRGVSLPFSDACELLSSNTDDAAELLTESINYGRAHKWKHLELRGIAGTVSAKSVKSVVKNPELRNPQSAIRNPQSPESAPSVKSVVKNPELRTQDSGLRTQDSALPTPQSATSTPHSALRTPHSTPSFSSYYGHTLNLSRHEDEIFAGFESSVRRAIRKAEKTGVTVEISRQEEDMRAFYALHCQTRQKHGVPPQPYSFFASFHRHIIAQNLGFVVIARFEGKPAAASVFVHLGSRALYKYGASDESLQHLRGANQVMWHAIQWYARAGFEQLHFGRTDRTNEGLRRFKLGWGAAEQPIDYARYDFRQNCFVTGRDESPGLIHRVVQITPLPISRLVGRFLYRHAA